MRHVSLQQPPVVAFARRLARPLASALPGRRLLLAVALGRPAPRRLLAGRVLQQQRGAPPQLRLALLPLLRRDVSFLLLWLEVQLV